jgi:hypothetical protein
MRSELFEKVLRENIVGDLAGKAWNATGGKVVNAVKDKAVDIAKGVGKAALVGGAAYLGAKNGEKKAQDEAEQERSEFSAAAELTDTTIGLDKQKYSQLAKIFQNDPELQKNHTEEAQVISQVNTALQKFKVGE